MSVVSLGGPGRLASLRSGLELLDGPREVDGAPTWTLHDPLRRAFYRIGRVEAALLGRWSAGTPSAVAHAATKDSGLPIGADEAKALEAFLAANQLVVPPPGAWRRMARPGSAEGPLTWLLHRYLFFRVPLVRPDAALKTLARVTAPMFSRAFLVFVLLAAFAAAYLASHQWDQLGREVAALISFDQVGWMLGALATGKLVHELGHGLVARRLGVRVPTAGIAFLVFWPVFYTDTTDAWRLPKRWQRLAIAAAGMAAEALLAVAALLTWSLAGDGALRTAALSVATVSLATTLAVNLTPFMRFDGYFILSDALDLPNLQDRGFAMARWWMRRCLFGYADPAPEPASPVHRRILIAWAVATWCYRLVLFLGIAVLVYHFFVKAIGILLFVVELGWFIGRPVLNELAVWYNRASDVRPTPGGVLALGLLAAGTATLLVPWQGTVAAPALLRAELQTRIFPPTAAQLLSPPPPVGTWVAAGETLATLAVPDLGGRIEAARARVAEANLALAQSAVDPGTADQVAVLAEDLAEKRLELASLETLAARLVVTAPFSGILAQSVPWLAPGVWLAENQLLGVLVDPARRVLVAYVEGSDVARLRPGGVAQFRPDDPDLGPYSAILVEVEPIDARLIEEADLVSPNGGGVTASARVEGRFRPDRSVYRVRLEVDAGVFPLRTIRGEVWLVAARVSPGIRMFRHAASVLVRESGF